MKQTNYYNQISKSYNELHKEEQLKKLEIIKQNLKVKPKDKLLDVGCGTGISSNFPGNVIGIDPSTELLKQNPHKHILGKAEELPFKDNEFDIIVSITAIQNFTNIEKALKEIKRVGKNKFALTFLKKSKKKPKILNLIKKHFKVKKVIEEDKDIIVFT